MKNKESTFGKVYERIMGKTLDATEESVKAANPLAMIDDIISCIEASAIFDEDKKCTMVEFMNKSKKNYG
jgi:hypothetical protein